MNRSEIDDWVAKIRSSLGTGSRLSNAVREWNVDKPWRGLQGNPKETYILKPKYWEELLAPKSIGASRAWQVLVVVPSYEVYLTELSATRILVKEASGGFKIEQFFDVSTVMREVLENLVVQRRRFRVFCSADVLPGEERDLKNAATEVLGQ